MNFGKCDCTWGSTIPMVVSRVGFFSATGGPIACLGGSGYSIEFASLAGPGCKSSCWRMAMLCGWLCYVGYAMWMDMLCWLSYSWACKMDNAILQQLSYFSLEGEQSFGGAAANF